MTVYQRATIRKLPGPVSKDLARRINGLGLELDRLKRTLPQVSRAEADAIALWRQGQGYDVENLRSHSSLPGLFDEEPEASGVPG